MSSAPLSSGGAHQPIGFSSDNTPVFSPYRPTVRKLADQIPPLIRSGVDLSTIIPAPDGFSFHGGGNSQLQMTLSGDYARRFRRIFGYAGDIQLAVEARGTATPTRLQVVAIPPWRYGNDPIENDESFIFCRVGAFASKSLLTVGGQEFLHCAPTFSPTPLSSSRGDPVVGFLETSPGGAKSAQLTGWGKTDVLTWQGARMDHVSGHSCFSSTSFRIPLFSAVSPLSAVALGPQP